MTLNPQPETLNITTLVLGACAANAHLVCPPGREDAFLIDAGDDWHTIEAALARTGRRLTDILLTHGHFDHALAAAHLRRALGARIRIHPADAHMLLRAQDALMGLTPAHDAFLPERADELFPQEDGPIRVCGVDFECLHTPGHTGGCVSLYAPAAKIVFTGDTLFAHGYGRTDFPGGDFDAIFRSVRRLLALPADTLAYPGHGERLTIGEIAADYRR